MHAEDAHVCGSDKSMMWLYDSLIKSGLKLLPAVIHGKGEAYVYLKTECW